MIADDICRHIRTHYPEQRIADVRIGLGYTAVLLEDGNAGVAYTFKENLSEGCSIFIGMRPLVGKSTHDLLGYMGSARLIESSVGVAVANALVNRDVGNAGDILSVLELRKEDRVGMVGFFGPLIPALKKTVKELFIFEKVVQRAPGLFPSELAQKELPNCDVALITSTSLINGTIDSLLAAAAQCREVVLLGASTLLLPSIFSSHHVTLLSGVVITDPAGIVRIVSEGGGMRFFKGYITKANFRINAFTAETGE